MKRALIAGLCLAWLGTNLAHAVVPNQITVQGRLTDLSGTPLPPGPTGVGFRIFTAAAGGTQIWPASSWEFQSVDVGDNGLWTGQLGALLPLTDAVFSDSARWLEVSVGMTILPRVKIVTGPFAYRVATVDGASGGAITSKTTIGPGNSNPGEDGFAAGQNNTANGEFSVALGAFNWADERSCVGGGVSNSANALYATVSGGNSNLVESDYGTVGGGANNEVTGSHATIAGGKANIANAAYATIGGGGRNTASGLSATVAGGGGANPGDANTASGDFSFIGGGQENVASGWSSTVSGGFVNYATSEGATIGGGVANSVSGVSAVVAGGNSCMAPGPYATIAGGLHNYAADSATTIGGGGYNKIFGYFSTIAGGGGTLAEDSNHITGWWGVIGGGRRNSVGSGLHGTIAGGVNNRVGTFATVGGGSSNLAYNGSTVGGGESNEAGGHLSTVGGGNFNHAVGEMATVPGGLGCEATGQYSLAAGHYARAHHDGSFVWSDETFYFPGFDSAATTAPNQFIIRATGGVGIGTTMPSQALHVMGNILASGCVSASNVFCPSDARFKSDIRAIPDALDKIDQLSGVNFEWRRAEYADRGFAEGEQVGLIAQDVQKVVPQAVMKQKDGYLAVDYARLVPLLIEGMKEQQRQIDELKATIKSMSE